MVRDIITLEEDELRRLAKLVYYQEVGNIQKIDFKSESERRKQLMVIKDAYTQVSSLLDYAKNQIKEFFEGGPKDSLAHVVFENLKRTINISIQFIRSWKVRKDCLDSATKHTQSLIKELLDLDMEDTTSVAMLQADLIEYDKQMVKFAQEQSQFFVKYASKGYNKLSTWISNENMTFGNLLERFKTKLGYEGPFKKLPEEQQRMVYQQILEAGGRKKAFATVVGKAFGAAGVLCLVAAAGTMVWDIYTANNKLLAASYDAVDIAAGIIGSIVAKMVMKTVLEAIGEEAAIVLGLPLGPVGEIIMACVVSYAISKFGDWLVDELFSVFGKNEDHSHDPKPEPTPQPNQTPKTSVSIPTPNARAIAYQIAYRRKST